MKTLITTIAAATFALSATSASAFFGNDDTNSNGYGTATTDGAFDGRGRGAGKGKADAEGNFSMTINASGRGSSDMEADMDADSKNTWRGNGDFRGENSPSYYGPYGYGYYNNVKAQ